MSKKRISAALWIEDQHDSFPVILDVLEEAADEVDVVTTAVDAQASLERRHYDVIVADALLPRGGDTMDNSPYLGLALLKVAKEPTRRIVVSFMAKDEVRQATAELGNVPEYTYFSKLLLGPSLDQIVRLVNGDEDAKPSDNPK